jgi:2-polyprenyl-3-methyl-5-hydroxy-6-metoxy-1,4-benzoquinol methylase
MDRLHKIDERRFDYVRCRECGLVYMNPQIEPAEVMKYYPAEYGPYRTEYELLSYGPILKTLKRNFNKLKSRKRTPPSPSDTSTDTYLDFGCGSGANLEKMRRQHPRWDLYGLDVSEHACAATKAKGFTVYHGTIDDVVLPERFFDHVYLSHVIEHLHDPKAVLNKLSASMKPGANITLATPNVNSLAFVIFRSFWFPLDAPRHLFLFSPRTLSDELAASGFEVTSITFDREPKVIIRSLAYVCFGQSTRIPAPYWHILSFLLTPVSVLLSYFGKTSIMTVQAVLRA